MRAPTGRVLERDAWTFYAGDDTWSPEVGDAVVLFEAMDMTSAHWNGYLDRWVAIYSPPLANRIALRTAPALTGPWAREVTAAETRVPADGSAAYSGLGHAEYQRGGGRYEYVTYHRNTGPWEAENRLVELELAPR